MAKADALQLVTDLGDGLASSAGADDYYEDAVFELGLSPNESLTNAAFVAVSAGTATYDYPTAAVRLLSLLYDTIQLQPSDVLEAQLYDKQWRTTRAEPRTWLIEQERRRKFTLVPVPSKTGAPVGVSTPFSATFPEGNITALFNEDRADVHPYEELIIALDVVKREFARDSDHLDHEFAQACEQVMQFLKTMIEQT